MTTPPSKIIPVSAQTEEFSLGQFLDTLYRWTETQPWCEDQLLAAWHVYTQTDQPLPDPEEPDEHDRLFRFWNWYALDRQVEGHNARPIDLFVQAHAKDLTDEGRTVYQELARTVYGVYRVQSVMPGRLVVLENMATQARHHLHEKSLADELQKGDLVVGRLYPHGEGFLADPDVHIGHVSEAPEGYTIDAPGAETCYFTAMVPSKGHVLDVLDALLLQVDSPLTADDVVEMIKTSGSVEELVDTLYRSPAYKMRYLHMRDRSLVDELLNELWDTTGPLQEAELNREDAAALTRTVRLGLKAIAEGDRDMLLTLADPKGFLPLYLDLFGMPALQKLADVQGGPPGPSARPTHQLLPKDGGIFTTFLWERDGEKHTAGVVAHGTAKGDWRLSDLSPPEKARPTVLMAYDSAKNLGWATPEPPDAVEGYLRASVVEVGYSVHDTIDLFRLWRDFKTAENPDLAQPGIWAAGVELADAKLRNENPDLKMLAKSYRVMPWAIENAAQQIEAAMKKLYPAT